MGSKGCSCINVTDTLASLSERRCDLPNGGIGIRLTVIGGQCVPFSYGSSLCLQHDLLYDPLCDVNKAAERIIPAFCLKPWCYVDVHTCRKESQERVFYSSYFSRDSGVDLYYSYTTCNSTADDFLEAVSDIAGDRPFGGASIDAAIPMYMYPLMFKRDSNEEVLITSGEEFYDDNIPYEGVYINYAKNVQKLSGGDIQNMTFTHKSQVSSIVHPKSSFTASIQDIEDGFIDMAIGPFWITGERLAMSAFTIPIVSDKTFLVIPRPKTDDKLSDQIQKVLAPLTPELWFLLAGIIFCTALLSVWFTDRFAEATNQNQNQDDRQMSLQRNIAKKRRRKRAYARLALDSCLQKGLFFCSAGVEQDENASLPSKLLLFGFGFFILISVSAYVANLAAFLTLSTTDFINTMEGAVAADMTICAHPAVKVELEIAWPDANFHFDQGDFHVMLEYVKDGICPFMAVGHEDTVMDSVYLAKLCERDLVFTDSVVAEIPIAFPIRADLASGFSYWMYKGGRSGVTLQHAKDEHPQEKTCDVRFFGVDESSDYDSIGIKNMFLPILFFVTCTALAVIMQIVHICQSRRGKESLVGTRSSLNLVSARLGYNSDKEEDKEFGFNQGMQSFDDYFRDNGLNGRIAKSKSIGRGSYGNDGTETLQLDDEMQHQSVTFSISDA